MANANDIDREPNSMKLINFAQPDLTNPLDLHWDQRRQIIAAEMEESLAKATQGLTSIRIREEISPRVVDAAHVIGKFTERGTSIGRIAEGDDPSTLIFALRKLGLDGRLYYIQPDADSDQKIRASIFRQFIKTILPQKATTPEELARVQRSENHLVELGYPLNYAPLLRGFLEDPKIPEIVSFYRRQRSDEAQAAFYNAFPITPIGGGLPESLSAIPDQSLRTFFVVDYFSKLEGDKQPALAAQLLRVLQPGGKLLFRDTPIGQAAAEYYVDQVAFNRLLRQDLHDLEDSRVWMLFTRKTVPEITYSFSSPEAFVEKTEHQKNLERLAAEVFSVLLESGVTDKNRSPEEVTAAARKIIGFGWLGQHKLLGTAMQEFGGNFPEMFAYAIETSMPKAEEPETPIPTASKLILAAEVVVKDLPEKPAVPAGDVGVETIVLRSDVPEVDTIVIGSESFDNQTLWTLEQITRIVAEVLKKDLAIDRVGKFLKEQGLVREQRGNKARGRKSGSTHASLTPDEAYVIANIIARNANSLKPKIGGRRGF